MKHTFYHKPDRNIAEAGMVAYAEVDTTKAKLRAPGSTIGKVTYGGGKYAVGVRLQNYRLP